MKWTTKAKIQNLVSKLPPKISYAVYYWLQTKFGKLETSNPLVKFKKAAAIAERIKAENKEVKGKCFFELGTGFRLNVPIALWLMGADRTYTVDLNPYLRWELIQNDIHFIISNTDEIKSALPADLLDEDRLQTFITSGVENNTIAELMDMCNIQYLAPADASKTTLKENEIDYHISNDVLEHIPPELISNILEEGKRLTNKDGMFIHMVDFTDHFSHSDKSITPINFLKFSDAEWNKYAGNRYMYMNRLRVDDIEKIFIENGHHILSVITETDADLVKMINANEIALNDNYRTKDASVLSVLRAWYVTYA